MDNTEIARLLTQVADLLEIGGSNPFRIRAYRNAARTVEAEASSLCRKLSESDADLTEMPGIGKDLAAQIAEICDTGKLTRLDELAAEVPRSLIDLMGIQGVGPKKAKKLWNELDIETVDQLEEAANAGKVAALGGFGKKSEDKILAGIADFRRHRERSRLDDADRIVGRLVEWLEACPELEQLTVCGSYRRRRETIGDLDLLAQASDFEPVMERFKAFRGVQRVEMSGDTRGTIVLEDGFHVDLRIVPEAAYGAALIYFTGSKEHNIKLRQRAIDRGWKLSEWGLFEAPEGDADPRDGVRVGATDERGIYESLEMDWVPPELREDRGEVAAAADRALPNLVTVDDIRGDLQMHSTWSDGQRTIEEMLGHCAARGYEYFAMTDHSKNLAMTGGLDAERLRQQWQEMDEIIPRHDEIRLLKSMEVDILRDGSLDLEDEMLEGLDLVLISIHSYFDLDPEEQTERVLKALAHPSVDIFAHPTARIINRRKPAAFDVEAALEACRKHNVAVELNAHPSRLDFKDSILMLAREMGLPVVISTDAHDEAGLELMHYGVEQARRAWLEPEHVLNTRSLAEFETWLRRRES